MSAHKSPVQCEKQLGNMPVALPVPAASREALTPQLVVGRIHAARVFPRRGRWRTADELVCEIGDGVGDVELATVIKVAGVQAGWFERSQKLKAEVGDGVGDVNLAVGVGVAADETFAVRFAEDDVDPRAVKNPRCPTWSAKS